MADTIDRKRVREDDSIDNENAQSLAAAAKKRRSRFDNESQSAATHSNSNKQLSDSKIAEAISSASARAAQLSKDLTAKGGLPSFTMPSAILNSTSSLLPSSNQSTADKMAQASEMQKMLAAQMASVSSMLNLMNRNKAKADKRAAYRPLLLDDQGRQIDEQGNVVKVDVQQVKTLAANVTEIKKKENPYLLNVADETVTVDDRLSLPSRSLKGKKALKFIEAGTFINLEDRIRSKEERKIIAGYASGRNAPELISTDSIGEVTEDLPSVIEKGLPPPVDGGVVPSMEWWDEAFLPKDLRELRKSSRAAAEIDNYDKVLLNNCKTYKYIQHPIPIKPLGGEMQDTPLPMYLTKKERKRIRKQTRAAREQEKRDKLMLGLIQAPEPKFKLSNFMKILGDQAVADPSKVERKVMEQMQKRQLNHEMRNLAAKLTPAEKKAKSIRKNQEDTSRQVHTAIFRIKDFTNPKHRFKVDVNAQQFFLSGTVILCPEGECNIVVVEGGPRGIRRFSKLMLGRIRWSDKVVPRVNGDAMQIDNIAALGDADNTEEDRDEVDKEEENENENDDDDEEDNGDNENATGYNDGTLADSGPEGNNWNYCKLVWQGIIPKRIFTGFRFQECKNQVISRKLLESKNVSHYWDMAIQSENNEPKLL